MRSQDRSGFILIAVLGVMALLASLAGGTALLVRSAVIGVRGGADDLKSEALIRAGIELAAYELYELRLPVGQITDQTIRLDDGSVTLTAADEAGRIDLNWSDPALLEGAYRVAGLQTLQPKDFAARVVAWRDRYEQKPSSAIAALGVLSLMAPSVGRGKDGFRSVADLRWLPDVSEDDVAALTGLVTVDNVQGKVNAAEASSDVLLAIPGVTSAVAAQVVALRASPNPTGVDRIKALLKKQEAFLTTTRGPSFRIRVSVSTGPSARRSVDMILTQGSTRDAPYYVTAWNQRLFATY